VDRQDSTELHEEAWTGKAIAAARGVSQSAVSQWLKRGREGGPEALRAQPPPGRMPRLTVEQRAELPRLLRHIPGQILVIWDRAPIHRAQAVKDFSSHGGAARPGGGTGSPSRVVGTSRPLER
jgi:hypothetical protein